LILEVKNLIADYGRKSLIRNLSFTVERPAFIAVLGHNGCGKTTFFRALTGQIPYQGDILLLEQSLKKIQHPARYGLVSVLEQKNQVNFSIRVLDLVVMGRFHTKRFFENYEAEDYAQAQAALAQLDAGPLAEQDFQQLSGGEQQMVWLAQLMLQDTPLYLLDEPTQQLDIRNKKKTFSQMQRWVQERGKTVLCVTHDLHNLYDMEGFMLNLSTSEPALERISPRSIQATLELMEK
jgi:iron complex transport system ATP-binding protein